MKTRSIKNIIVIILLLTGSRLLAQGPPNPPGDPSVGGGPIGGSAPVEGGLGVLLALGAAYGGNKIYRAFRKEEDSVVGEE